jgi:hypothetical protein
MANDLELVHLGFNRVKELSLIYGDTVPHLISIFNEPDPAGFLVSVNQKIKASAGPTLVTIMTAMLIYKDLFTVIGHKILMLHLDINLHILLNA